MKNNDQIISKNIKTFTAVEKEYFDKGYTIIEIDGEKILNKFDIFNIFSEKLQFPDYFGNNWDAFFDCIKDLSWIKNKNLIVLLKNIDDKEIFKTLLEQLVDAKKYWAEITKKTDEKVNFEAIQFE
jgi:RNAse (barnase) inhibitor barstar